MEDAHNRKRFFWAVLLACAPWVPTMVAISHSFVGISNSRATGLAAIAGGIAELLVWWGLGTMIISQIVAIVWLFRSFSRDHWLRNLASAFSIGLSSLMLLMVCFFLWSVWFQSRHG
jgi:hypothetical protein